MRIKFRCFYNSFKNKGLDISIRALADLNKKLIEENSKKTVIVFFWIPTQVESAKQSLAQNKQNYHQIKHFIEENSKRFQIRLIENLLRMEDVKKLEEEEFHIHNILGEEFIEEIRTLRLNFKR